MGRAPGDPDLPAPHRGTPVIATTPTTPRHRSHHRHASARAGAEHHRRHSHRSHHRHALASLQAPAVAPTLSAFATAGASPARTFARSTESLEASLRLAIVAGCATGSLTTGEPATFDARFEVRVTPGAPASVRATFPEGTPPAAVACIRRLEPAFAREFASDPPGTVVRRLRLALWLPRRTS